MATEVAMKHDDHLLLEQSFLKVPYELSRKAFKTSQRYIERDRDAVLASLKTGAQDTANSSTPSTTATESLDSMIARLETLKRKLTTLRTDESTLHQHARSRISHLQDLHDIPTHSSPAYTTWSQTRLSRLLVDYLLRSGHGASASALASAANIEDLVDISAFSSCVAIESSLRSGNLGPALLWCSENRAGLKKMESELESELRLQQYIELLRSRDTAKLAEATLHARKYLTYREEASKQAAGLLAFSAYSLMEPYCTLYSPSRYGYLASLFLKDHHSLLSLPPTPSLHIALSAGLSALKTPSCHSAHAASTGTASTATSGAGVCPICSTELNELARGVPWSMRTNSVVEAEPVMLPNGRIYGLERLRRLNEKMVGVGYGTSFSASSESEEAMLKLMRSGPPARSRPVVAAAVSGTDMELDNDDNDEDDDEGDDEQEDEGEEDMDDEDEEEDDRMRHNDSMSVEEEEQEGVPGGRGRVRDPMNPTEWFAWRDVKKVYIL